MYLDVKVRLSNKFWARHLADTVLMWLKCNSTPPFGVDSRLPAVVIATPMTLQAGYAASRISSKLKGSTKQFGWLQAPATNLGFTGRAQAPGLFLLSQHFNGSLFA